MSQTKAQLVGPVLGDVNYDSGTLFVDSVNNKVGVGTTNPIGKLSVSDGTVTGEINPYSSSGVCFIGSRTDHPVVIQVNAAEQARIDSSGIQAKDLYITESYPTETPSLALNLSQTKQLDSRVTFKRSSAATYVDDKGYVRTAEIDEPRFHHNSSTKESLGLLIEEQRTNYEKSSNSMIDYVSLEGYNYLVNMTGTDNVAVAPDKTSTAGLITVTASGGRASVFFTSSPFITKNTGVVYSAFIKANTTDQVDMHLVNSTNSPSNFSYRSYATFDLTNGTVGVVGNTADGSSQSTPSGTAYIESYPDGWYRCTISFKTFNGTNSLNTTIAEIRPNNGGSSGSVYVWGKQMEVGAFPTSHIPSTNGIGTTRAYEHAYIDGSNFTNFYNTSESTILVESRVNVDSSIVSGQYNVLHIGDSNADGYGLFRENGSRNKWFHIRSGNTSLANFNSGQVWPKGTNVKICFAIKSGDQAISYDGNTPLTDTVNTSSITNINQMSIGSTFPAAQVWNGTISRLIYYPNRLNNTQLQLLST